MAQVAAFALDHPDEIAFGTAAHVAEMAEVQPSTLVRFAQSIGYQGFSDLQRVFRVRLRERWPDYRERIETLRQRRQDGLLGLMDGFAESAGLSLMRLRERVEEADLERAVCLLDGAETIFLLGQRRAFPVTAYMAYALTKLNVRNVLIDNVASMASEQIAFASSRDAVVAVSFAPYTPATLSLAADAFQSGVPVLAITDSAFSPLTRHASSWFEVVETDFGAFRSLSATFALAMALVVAVGERRAGTHQGGNVCSELTSEGN